MKFVKNMKLLSILKLLIPIGLLIFIIWEGKKFSKEIDLPLLQKHIHDLSVFQVILILCIGIISINTMNLYDLVLKKRLHMNIPTHLLLQYSFMSNTMSNLFGFGGFAGAALRTYFYQKYKQDRIEVIKGVAELSVFYLSGLSILCWIFLMGFLDHFILNEYRLLYFAIWAIALYLPAMLTGLFLTKRIDFRKKKEWLFTLKLLFTSTLEWTFVFITIYVISQVLGLSISFSEILSIGIVGACAGTVSMIPGGLGSFDFILLLGLKQLGVMEEQAVLLLLFYRISYYFFPFLISILMLTRYFWKRLDTKWNGLPTNIIENISHFVVALLVFCAGVILLLSASMPSIIERLKFMHHIFSLPFMNISQLLSISVGITLLGLARGIEYKVKRAYYLAFIMLIVGAIFTFSKSFDYEEAIFALIVAFLLWLSRNRFYRENFIHTWGRIIVDLLIIFVVLGFYLMVGYANLPEKPIQIPAKFRDFIFTEPSDLWLSGINGFLVAIGILMVAYWVKRPAKLKKIPSLNESSKILLHLQTFGGTVLSHLMFLHDKAVYWTKDSNVLFSYQTVADKVVVLGNPVGDKDSIFKAIEELRADVDQFGYTPIYYQVSQTMLPYLHENGYDFIKLGEEGYVNLMEFTLTGKKMKGLRASKNKFDREGYQFEVISPPFSAELLSHLKEISDHWLGGRSEKGYSLGFYDESYISLTPIAIVRDHVGNPLAFSTVMPVYDDKKTISVDLMRFLPNAPNGTMDYIFLNLIEWAKEEGYQRFNLGMAPLSNVGISKYSFLSEKIAAQIYQQVHGLYHFQGVRKFKEKYADSWEPKYLAYKRKTSLLFTMLQLTYLIGKNNKS